MTLTQEALAQVLKARPFKFFPQVASTQDVALEWLREGAEAGSVVIADEQLAGRGRQGRTWYTPPGVALAVSLILRPPVKTLPQVTMLGALSIAMMLEKLDAEAVTIKWPNDVRLQGRKVSGVLPEAVWEGDKLVGVALGMGINVRNTFMGTELEQVAISIEEAMNVTYDRVELVQRLLTELDYWTLGTSQLFEAWRMRLDTIGQHITVNGISGKAETVDMTGALMVRDATNQVHRVVAGDVIGRE